MAESSARGDAGGEYRNAGGEVPEQGGGGHGRRRHMLRDVSQEGVLRLCCEIRTDVVGEVCRGHLGCNIRGLPPLCTRRRSHVCPGARTEPVMRRAGWKQFADSAAALHARKMQKLTLL